MSDTPSRFTLQAMAIAWPSFLMAGVLEMLVFAVVDPGQLHWFGGQPIELSPSAVYTLAFFTFWVVISLAGAITQLLEKTPEELNPSDAPLRPSRRGPGWPS